MSTHDVIAAIAGLPPQREAAIRGHRPDVASAAEQSLHALFDTSEHDEAPGLTRQLRLLSAARAARVEQAGDLSAFYLEQLLEEPASEELSPHNAELLVAEGADGATAGSHARSIRALLRHIDLLVQRPAAATPDDLDALLAADWNVTEIVLLSQIITFVSYQARAVYGLRVLQEAAK